MGYARSTHIIDDIELSIYSLLYELSTSTSPWTDWTIKRGFPEEEVLDQFDEPIIYVMQPIQVGKVQQQGQSAVNRRWRMTIGAWLDRKHGGTEELNIIGSRLMSLFEDPRTACVLTTFDITLGATAYTDTNLTALGIFVDGIEGPEPIYAPDEKEFRDEFKLYVIA